MRERKRSLMNSVRRFWGEERGSITIQVLTFSLLLLATTGIVLDSGRLYTQHSQMQAYTDQIALAAANELDGADDALTRAANAVFGIGEDPFLRKAGIELGEFDVVAVYFYDSQAPVASSKEQSDMTEAFPASAQVATAFPGEPIRYSNAYDETTGPQAARYAVVQAAEEATRSSLVRLTGSLFATGSEPEPANGNPGPRPAFQPNYSFGTVAAASVEERYCADLTTLVFCNPWEDTVDDPTTNAFEQHPFNLQPGDNGYSVPGRSLMHFAPNYRVGESEAPLAGEPVLNGQSEFESPYAWDLPHQLFKLVGPIVDEGRACDENNAPRLSEGEDYIAARDRCMMARADNDQVCWGGSIDLSIQPAHGPDVVRSVNTAFDIWLPPFEDMIQEPAEALGSTGLDLHEFFEPDALATTIFELADWYASGPGTMQDGNLSAETASTVNPFDVERAHYIAAPNLLLAGSGAGNAVGTYGTDVCHSNSTAVNTAANPDDPDSVANDPGYLSAMCDEDFIGDHYAGNLATTPTARGDMQSYWRDMYNVDPDLAATLPNVQVGNRPFPALNLCGVGTYEQDIPNLAEACAAQNLAQDDVDLGPVDTWYEVYVQERLGLNNPALAVDHSRSKVTANVEWDSGAAVVLEGDDAVEQTTGGLWGDGTNDADNDGLPDTPDYVTRYGLDNPADNFIKQRPMDYYDMSPSSTLFSPARERRRIRSALVNCNATVNGGPVDGTTNQYAVNFNDIRVLDFYLARPATYHCGLGPDVDADGNPIPVPTCAVEDSKDSLLFTEIIRDVTDEAATQRFVAKLVR